MKFTSEHFFTGSPLDLQRKVKNLLISPSQAALLAQEAFDAWLQSQPQVSSIVVNEVDKGTIWFKENPDGIDTHVGRLVDIRKIEK